MTSESLTIGIDGTGIWSAKIGAPSGVVNYCIDIIRALVQLERADSFIVYCLNEVPEQLRDLSSRAEFRTFRVGRKKIGFRKLVQQTWLPLGAWRDELNVVFFPFNSGALWSPCPAVVTIHDLHPYVVPERFAIVHGPQIHGTRLQSFINRAYWKGMLRHSARRSAHVITVSNATRNDVVNIFGVPAKKVTAVHHGIDRSAFNSSRDGVDLGRFRRRHGLPQRFILCVGTHGYKNLEGSIRAFERVRRQAASDGLKLVIAGNPQRVTTQVRLLIKDLDLEREVTFTGFFPDAELKYLYQAAELLLFPSYYEGFGLPVVEAFACGTPVVTSTAGSLPEVAGEAALLVDPYEPKQIADAILELLSDQRLEERMREAGFARARRFDWERAATKTLEVLRRVALEPAR